MTKPSLILLVEKSSNLNIQKVKIYETDEKQQKNVLFASGVLMGRLQSLEKNRVNLTLKDQSKVSGFMTRGNGAWKGAISLELNGSSSGALFRGCGEL